MASEDRQRLPADDADVPDERLDDNARRAGLPPLWLPAETPLPDWDAILRRRPRRWWNRRGWSRAGRPVARSAGWR